MLSDFEFEGGALNRAQKRVIRKAIERARKGADQPCPPAKPTGAGGSNEGAAALAALLGRKEEVSRGAPQRWRESIARARRLSPK